MIEYALQLLLSGNIYTQSTIFMNDYNFSNNRFTLIQDSVSERFAGLVHSLHPEIDLKKFTAEETTS